MGEAAVIWGRLTESFWLNCQLFGLTLLFAIPLGLVVAFGSMSRFAPLRGVVKTFVWAIRGTPLMLQILVIYLGPGLMGFTNPWPSGSSGRLVAAVVVIGLVVLAQWFFLYFFQYSYPAYALTHHYLPKYFYTLLFLPLLYLINRGLSQALGTQEKGTL